MTPLVTAALAIALAGLGGAVAVGRGVLMLACDGGGQPSLLTGA